MSKYFYNVVSESEVRYRAKENRERTIKHDPFNSDVDVYYRSLDEAVKHFKELRSKALVDIENCRWECPEDTIVVICDRDYIFSYRTTMGDDTDDVESSTFTVRIIREEFAD